MIYIILAQAILLLCLIWKYVITKKVRIVISPYPVNKTFAFTIIDDTDGATVENVKPVYDYLASINMKTTKTLWVYPPESEEVDERHQGDTTERKQYLDFLKTLQNNGFELALHNVSSQSNKRMKIIKGLERFKQLFGNYPEINVSHEKNKENIYLDALLNEGFTLQPFSYKLFSALYKIYLDSRKKLTKNRLNQKRQFFGEIEGSDYFWGDICKEKIKYIRSNFFFQEINTLKVNPNIPYYDSTKPYVNFWFDSSNGQDCETFNKLLTDKNIKKLKKEGGCCILYTHFGKGFVDKSNGIYQLNEETKSKLREIASDDSGWFVPVSVMLDRFKKIKNIYVSKSREGIVLYNNNEEPISDLVIYTNPNRLFYDLNGTQIKATDQGQLIVDRLEGHQSKILLFKKYANDKINVYWKDRDRSPLIADLITISQKIKSKIC